MSNQVMLEKLDFKDEKNILIQCLPSSIEKQFAKLSYAKNVTPLLRHKKIDFALVFAINQQQLAQILEEVFTALHDDSKLWVAYPKETSKIVSDLGRSNSWEFLNQHDYLSVNTVTLDHVWNAMLFKKNGVVNEDEQSDAEEMDEFGVENERLNIPEDFKVVLNKNGKIKELFSLLSSTHQKEYVEWIESAKKTETHKRRIEQTIDKLKAGEKSPYTR